jgi:hypothetical protein
MNNNERQLVSAGSFHPPGFIPQSAFRIPHFPNFPLGGPGRTALPISAKSGIVSGQETGEKTTIGFHTR